MTALNGRVALVTGGTRGIGLSAARSLAAAGARVAVCARTAETCKNTVEELERSGAEAVAVVANVGHLDEIPGVVSTVVDRFGAIDVVVNNAGASLFAPLSGTSVGSFDKVFHVNVLAPLLLVQHAVAAGLGRGGSVINVVSALGLKSEAFLGVYAASKAALISATKTLARELGPDGIRVNAVAPGVIRTDFAKLMVETPQIHDKVIAATALGRVGEADEIGGAIAWLASDEASYMTGAVLVIDGGTLA